jgi:hypothetical protein
MILESLLLTAAAPSPSSTAAQQGPAACPHPLLMLLPITRVLLSLPHMASKNVCKPFLQSRVKNCSGCSGFLFVYYESIKREPKIRGINKCRCDERLQTKTKEFTRLPYTGLVGCMKEKKKLLLIGDPRMNPGHGPSPFSRGPLMGLGQRNTRPKQVSIEKGRKKDTFPAIGYYTSDIRSEKP